MHSLNGGHLKDVKQWRQLPRWYARRPREIAIRVMKYYGVGVHYHLSIMEDDEAFEVVAGAGPRSFRGIRLEPGEALKWTPWDLPQEMRGRTSYLRCNTPADVEWAIRTTIRRWKVTRKTHVVHWQNYADDVKSKPRWYYGEGD